MSDRIDSAFYYPGVIWRDAPDADAIVSARPRSELSFVEVRGFRFALWQPKPSR